MCATYSVSWLGIDTMTPLETADSGIGIHEINGKNRVFIPMVQPYISPKIMRLILPYTKWIGFNCFELRHSKFYDQAKRKGLRKTFDISDETKIFLTTVAKDKELIRFYDEPYSLETLKSEISNFDVDMAMGPDWYSYQDDPQEKRKENLERAIELNMSFVDLENVVPTIRGTNFQEVRSFVQPFKSRGKRLFVLTGREYLINRGNRKKAQTELSSLTSAIKESEKIRLIVTGCNSPKLMATLSAVSGFSGLGWLIQSKKRRLIMGKTYLNVSDPRFLCKDSRCCRNLDKDDLKNPEQDSVRAVHNLVKINAQLNAEPMPSQICLEGFDGDIP